MNLNRLYEREQRILVLSVLMNVCLIVLLIVLAFMGDNVTPSEKSGEVDYSYLDNPQYLARYSTFDISQWSDAEIVFAGDSITLYEEFDEFLNSTCVANRGIGSDISEGLLNRADQIVELNPEIVFVMIGINDIVKEIPTDETVKNTSDFCKIIREELPNCNLYILSVLPAKTLNEAQNQKLLNINNGYKYFCTKTSIADFVDIYNLYLNNDGTINMDLFSEDGVHLNGKGYSIWVDAIREYIR